MNMKKIYLLLITVIVSVCAMANPVTPDEARQRIAQFMNPRRAPSLAQHIESLRLVETSYYRQSDMTVAASYYVFNAEGQGFVIASADDRVPAVLGYSDKGTFVPNEMPANMIAWLKSYDKQMEYLHSHPEAAARRAVTGAAIEPLIKTHWDQRSPYNNLCPMDGENRSLTGCVATAMAQVMYYWKYPAQTSTEIPSYTLTKTVKGEEGDEEVKTEIPAIPAATPFDWDNMKLEYNGTETEEEQNAIANLMLTCGTALKMDYSSAVSNAYTQDMASCLINYMDYDLGTRFLSRGDYRYAEWCQIIYDELAAKRPVLYGGQSAGGGHAFIVDGYRSDDYFHINWGWGGSSDNYFLLSILDSNNTTGSGASSSTDGYSFNQDATIGVQPNTGVAPKYDVRMTSTEVALPGGTSYSRSSANQNFSFKIQFDLHNRMDKAYAFNCGIGLLNDKLELIKQINVDQNEFTTAEMPVGNYFSTDILQSYGFFNVRLGKDLAEGTYYIAPISREKGKTQWFINAGAERCMVKATVGSVTLKLTPPTFALTTSLDVPGKKEALSGVKVNAAIKNEGTLFMGEVFLLVNNEMVGGRHIDMDAGESATLDFTFYPKTAGECKLELCTRAYNYEAQKYVYTPFASKTITIAEAQAANISMVPTIVNMNQSYTVEENKVVIKLKITNNGDTEYDNVVHVYLYKLIPNTEKGTYAGRATKEITLPAGQTIEEEVQIEDLESGATYFFWCLYTSKGQLEKGYPETPLFKVNYDTGISETLMSEVSNEMVKVYNTKGVQMAEVPGASLAATLKTMPKGVYVVRSGKKSFKMVQPN